MTLKGTLLFLALCAAAFAQHSNGYIFVAPGGVTSGGFTNMTIQLGAGADLLIAKGFGVNLELSALGPRQDFSSAVGVFSPGGVYYFRRGQLEPFVAGGYSLFFRSGHENFGFLAGGVNYWFAHRAGLRLEFRDHIHSSFGTVQFWGFRFGLALR